MERLDCNLQTTNALQVNQVPNHEKVGLPQRPTLYSFLKQRFDPKEENMPSKKKASLWTLSNKDLLSEELGEQLVLQKWLDQIVGFELCISTLEMCCVFCCSM
jgi:hypothetical protein